MRRNEIEELKEKVGCGALLESFGFTIDIKESTRRAVKYRRAAEIIIVTHEGKGWFDPLSEDKGDIFSLAKRLGRGGFVASFERVAALVGYLPSSPLWKKPEKTAEPASRIGDRWSARRSPWRGSATWRYLATDRVLPSFILNVANSRGLLREGPYGSMWAAHVDEAGNVCGWEERGPDWRGFSTGGAKTLFRLGSADGPRLCVTEAAIDAMSLAGIEGLREGTLYLSTGGGWSPVTEAALRALATRPGSQLVAATDANSQGHVYAERLRAIADGAGCAWQRLLPPEEDWNEALQELMRRKRRTETREGVPHARQPRQGRLRPAKAGP